MITTIRNKAAWFICLIFLVLIIIPGSASAAYSYENCFDLTNNDPERYNATLNRTLDSESLVSAGKMLSNCQDLAVYDKNESEYLNFNFTSCNTTTTNIYFKIINFTATTTKEICYRYDDAGASDNSSLWRNVYQELDDHNDGSINTDIWNLTGADIIESEGMLHIRQPDASWSADFIQTIRAFSTPVLIEFEYNRRTSEYFGTGWANLDALNDFPNNMQNATRFYIDGVNDRHDLYANHNGVMIDQQFGSANTVGTWYNGSLRMNSTYYDMLINGVADNSVHRPINFTQPIPVYMAGYDMGGANANTSINFFRVSTWFTIEPTYGGFKGEASIVEDGSPSITTVNPQNTTYYNGSIILNFTATDDTLTTFPCWYFIDGTPTSIGNLTNNTYYNTTLSLNGAHYNLTVRCEDMGVPGNGSATVFFHVFSGFNVSVYDNDTNASMTDWTICFENSTDQDCSADQNNSVLFEWNTVPQGSVNITVSDGFVNLYYSNSTYARTNNESNYENLSAYLQEKSASTLALTASPAWTIDVNTEITITCTASEDTPDLYRDGISVSNPYTATLDFALFNFTCAIGETANYAPASTTNWLNVLSGGFGCTDNATYAFTKTITTPTNNMTLNFTTLVNNNYIKSDLSDVRVITTNTSTTKNESYLMVDTENVSNITVHFANYFANISHANATLITESVDNMTSYSENDPYYVLTFLEETTGTEQLPPNSTRTLVLYCSQGTTWREFNGSQILVAANEQLDSIKALIEYTATEIYYRSLITRSAVEHKNFYLVDADEHQVAQLLITLQDATGDFSTATLIIRKYLEGTLETITELDFDAEDKAIIYLINGDRYQIYVDNGAETRSIGYLYVDTVDLSKTITIGEVLTTNQTHGNVSFGLYNTSDTIVFSYIDAAGQAISGEMWVYNASNMSQLLYYANTTNRSRFEFTYQVPSTNQTYNVHVKVGHTIFGENSIDLWMPMFSSLLVIPHPLEPLSGIFGTIPGGIRWQDLVGVFAVIGAALLFTAHSGAMGGVFAASVGSVLLAFGWWNANVAILAVAFVLGILNKLTERKRES